ncbi:MAG TPA: diphosphate--fructose-6-phosphate 1-phosphotransferase [Bryobacteraceae bacterium]|nr:diphosphate--fructose-6-phosphate 1-phosphotransferase [Bryobacteraceae bacterium]
MHTKAAVAHGGGPTAVINASLAGLIEACRERGQSLCGARYGLAGLLRGDFVDLLALDAEFVQRIGEAPGSALGSSRLPLADSDYECLFDILRRAEIHTFFYTGGNGSMDTALRVSRRAREAGYELQAIGIPKTIDNDLCVTDHTPGYASTARFFACAARDVGEDNRSLPSPVCVLETLGRNAGWIVAAASLARHAEDDAPHLIYLPERRLSLDRIAADVERVYARLGRVVIAVCEGQLDDRGRPFGADVDRAESNVHRLASNLGHTLARLLTEKLGIRARAEKPGLLGRCCGPFATARDRAEAFACGRAAALAAAAGHAKVMVALRRDGSTFLTPLGTVARVERLLPADWIHPDGNDVLPAFREYAAPLIGEVPGWPHF